jgi:rhamnogalacturonyl hydrolase YesR
MCFATDDDLHTNNESTGRYTAVLSHSAPALQRPDYADKAARRLLAICNSGQKDAHNALVWHGSDDAGNIPFCCQWGDGNGWLLMGMADALIAFRKTNNGPN